MDFSQSASAHIIPNGDDGNEVDLPMMIQLCTEHFSRSYMKQGKLPSGVQHAWVLCKFDCAAWKRVPGRAHEAAFHVQGFVQTKKCPIERWQKWLPPSEFRWEPLLGGLCGNEDYETAKRELLDPNSNYPWLELLSEGALRLNIVGRKAMREVSGVHPPK